MVLEKELGVLHLDLQAAEGETATLGVPRAYIRLQAPPSQIYFLLQGHTYCNKDISPSSTSPYGPNIQIHESMGP